MTANVVPNPARERELLANLGLGPGASDDEVDAAHDDIVRFLEDAPSSLRGWARGRLSEADRTYAILSGGLPDSGSAARPAPALPLPTAIDLPAARPASPAPATHQKHRSNHNGRSGGRLVDEDEIAMLDEQDGHSPTAGRNRPQKPGRQVQRVSGGRIRVEPAASGFMHAPMRRYALVGGLLVAFAAIAVVGYKLGEPSSVPGINGSPVPGATTAAVDPAAVTALMEKLTANPKDITTLKALADLYYAGGDFQAASSWLDKVLAIDPKNITALLGSGAAAYNLGDDDGAEQAWRAVLAIDDNNVEAHYDLGWMYLGKDPTDVVKLRIEWTRVIALDPGSDAAKTALSHLQRLDPSFSPPPAATAVPASPAPSSAPTAQPS